jgi:hypothetical protein
MILSGKDMGSEEPSDCDKLDATLDGADSPKSHNSKYSRISLKVGRRPGSSDQHIVMSLVSSGGQ